MFRGALISVHVEAWPGGEREVVRHPGACAIVALAPGKLGEEVILVRQYREAVRRSLLEIPAGILDVPGESGSGCAARELLEETGYRALEVEPIGEVLTSPGFADERIELFAARAEPVPGGQGEEGLEVVRMTFADALRAVRTGEITDAKSVAGLLLVGDRDRPGYASHAGADAEERT